MNLKNIVVMVPLAVLAMAGCSKTGTSGESNNSVKGEQSHSIEKSLELRHERSAKISVEMSAQVLEVNALKFYEKHALLIGHVVPKSWHWDYAYKVVYTEKPLLGWPCNNPFDQRCPIRVYHWNGRYAVFSNLLLTYLAQTIPASGAAYPASAEADILQAFNAMTKPELHSMWAQAKADTSGGGVTMNGTGNISGGNMQFFVNGRTFTGGPNGMTIVKDGVHWFGDGYLSGKKVMVSLDSVINKAGSQKQLLSSMSANETNMSTSSHASTEAEGE